MTAPNETENREAARTADKDFLAADKNLRIADAAFAAALDNHAKQVAKHKSQNK
jgi:hypothetical protein